MGLYIYWYHHLLLLGHYHFRHYHKCWRSRNNYRRHENTIHLCRLGFLHNLELGGRTVSDLEIRARKEKVNGKQDFAESKILLSCPVIFLCYTYFNMKMKPDFLLLEEDGEKPKKFFSWQFLCALGVFALIFLWANVFCDYSGTAVNKIGILKFATVSEPAMAEVKDPPSKAKETPPPLLLPNIKLAFVGDVMLDRGVKKSVYDNFGGDYAQLFTKVKSQLQSYDLLFANLEGPVSDVGVDGGALYSFRFEPKVIPVLKDVGFDIFSVANNHIFNWGRAAFEDTLNHLTAAGISYAGGGQTGTEAYQEKIIDVSGVKVAFLAFSEFKDGAVSSTSTKSGIALINEQEVQKSVSRAKSQADLVVVSYHFGDEYELAHNDFQQKYAELAVNAGADLVVASHSSACRPGDDFDFIFFIW